MNIVTLIPARSGSKGIKNKNIIKINSKPLIAYSIILAKNSNLLKNEVYVSTNSKKIKKYAKKYGAEVPFLRPEKLAKDNSSDLDVFKHFNNWYKKNKKKKIDLIVHLRPTTPFRKLQTLEKAINIIKKNINIDCLRTCSKSEFSPYKMWFKNNKNFAKPVILTKNKHSIARQLLPVSYDHNGYVDILRISKTIEMNSMTGKKVYLFELDRKKECCIDIDEPSDLKKSEKYFKNFQFYKKKK
tara:strand:- start:779 stop:1504 length:726 start_codon:yes stop_codon:yes gene_type:complete